jgi:hypothetical protein
MAEYLGLSVHMVKDVHEELERLSDTLPALKTLLEDWPRNPVRELDLDLKADVAAAMKARRIPGQHPNEDRGETATVFYAARRRDQGEVFDVLTDDTYGKQLVRDRGFALVTTASLTIEMVRGDALSSSDGKRVWRLCVGRSRWNDFDVALARAKASS